MMRLTKTELARRLRCSAPTITKHLSRPDAPQADERGRYDLAAVRQHITARRQTDNVSVYAKLAAERARLTSAKADVAEMDRKRMRGELLSRAEVEHERRDTAEVLRSDLGALSTRQASLVAGRKLSHVQARALLHGVIVEMVKRWHEAGNVEKEAIP